MKPSKVLPGVGASARSSSPDSKGRGPYPAPANLEGEEVRLGEPNQHEPKAACAWPSQAVELAPQGRAGTKAVVATTP